MLWFDIFGSSVFNVKYVCALSFKISENYNIVMLVYLYIHMNFTIHGTTSFNDGLDATER